MVPSVSEIVRRRLTVVAVIRTIAFLFGIAGVGFVLIWFFVPWVDEWTNHLDRDWLGTCLVLVIISAALASLLWVLAPWESRRIIRFPKAVICPECRYKLEGVTEARCPECGIVLTTEFMGAEPHRPAALRQRLWSARLAMKTTLALRFVSILGLIFWLVLLVALVVSFTVHKVSDGGVHPNDRVAFVAWLLICISGIAIAVLVAAVAPRLTRFMLPDLSMAPRAKGDDA